MATKTEFTCDRCGKTWEVGSNTTNVPQRWNLKIDLQCHPLYNTATVPHSKGAEWCRECCEHFHLLPIAELAKRGEQAKEKPPTLEEIIREIVREEIDS